MMMWRKKTRRHSTAGAEHASAAHNDTENSDNNNNNINNGTGRSIRFFRRSSDSQLVQQQQQQQRQRPPPKKHRQQQQPSLPPQSKQQPPPSSPSYHRRVRRSSLSRSPRHTLRRPKRSVRIEQLVADEIERTINDPGWDDDDDDENDVTLLYCFENENPNETAEIHDIITQRHHHSWAAGSGNDDSGTRRNRRRLSLSSLRGLGSSGRGNGNGRGGSVSSSSFKGRRRGSTSSSSVTWAETVTTSTTVSTLTQRRRNKRGGGGHGAVIGDSCINGYSLFGDDHDTKYSRSRYWKKSSSSSPNKAPAVIYAKNYNIGFTPLIMFLGGTFIVLLILRIVISLLTVATGVIVVLIVVATLIDFLRHPRHNAKRLLTVTHNSPILVFGGLGGLSGACICLWVHRKTDEASLVWGLLEGMVYGGEIGALWLVVLGDGSEHSSTALCIIRLWNQVCDRVCNHDDNDNNNEDADDSCSSWDLDGTIHDGDDGVFGESQRRKCMICLGTFGPQEARQLLPCLHGFHEECLAHWLRVKKTCPICRISSMTQEQHNEATQEEEEEGPLSPPSPNQNDVPASSNEVIISVIEAEGSALVRALNEQNSTG